jgi:hypothetical protein
LWEFNFEPGTWEWDITTATDLEYGQESIEICAKGNEPCHRIDFACGREALRDSGVLVPIHVKDSRKRDGQLPNMGTTVSFVGTGAWIVSTTITTVAWGPVTTRESATACGSAAACEFATAFFSTTISALKTGTTSTTAAAAATPTAPNLSGYVTSTSIIGTQ